MRPLRLRVENFTAFRGPQATIDFEGLDLFAIAGPTGAGKSSLLDAMLFALYGSVPRLPRAKSASELISLGRERMSVVLDFALGPESFRVMRSARRGGSGDAQLERLLPGGGVQSLAGGVKEVGAELERRLALSYDAFSQAVVLPQGEFARFLRSAPKERQEILRDLLRLNVYERMRQRADADARVADATARAAEEALASLFAGATPEAIAALEARLVERRESGQKLGAKLRRKEAEAEELRRLRAATRARDAARRSHASLLARALEMKADESRLADARKAAAVLPRVEAAARAAGEARETAQLVTAAARRAEAARSAQDTAAGALAAAEKAAAELPGLAARIEALVRAQALQAPLADATKAAAEARARAAAREKEKQSRKREAAEASAQAKRAARDAEKAARAGAAARVAEAAAEVEARAAREALRAAERKDAVASLRRGLGAGDPCPICERPLARKPKASEAARLQAAEEAVRTADAAREKARAAAEAARGASEVALRESARAAQSASAAEDAAARAAREAEAAETEAAAAGQRASVLDARMRELSPERDPAAAARVLRERAASLSAALDRARTAQAGAATAAAAAEAELRAARQAAEGAETRAAEAAAGAAEAARAAGFASPQAALAAALSPAAQAELAEAVSRYARERHAAEADLARLEVELQGREASEEQLGAAEQELRALRSDSDAGVREEATLAEQLASAHERTQQAEARRQQAAEARGRQALLRQLALDLQSGAFQAWLLEETFAELVAGASQRLLELSGRYGLAHADKAFYVVDHDNAGELRRAETLSGGETFLASLALALELSQQVQRAAGALHLESLFIDEGFGTLDAETLDAVTGAIESLPRAGRMVGVITHLRELTDRLPARISVERGADGSRARVEIG
ncbi:MAG: AAA family ATPase [Vicinamibacteria bacterium]